jgi:hypothetical protein
VLRAGWGLQTGWFANQQACAAVDVQWAGRGSLRSSGSSPATPTSEQMAHCGGGPDGVVRTGMGLYIRVAAVLGAPRRGSGIVCPHCGARSTRRSRRP